MGRKRKGLTDDALVIPKNQVLRGVAQQTGLSIEQVDSCFKAYFDIHMTLIEDSNRPDNLVMSLPYYGDLKLKLKHGKKAGFSKKLWDYGANEFKIYTIAEDKPDYQLLEFVPQKKLQTRIREVTERRFRVKKKLVEQYGATAYSEGRDHEETE